LISKGAVSILVFLDQALKVYQASIFDIIRIVSILVFLDQALKADFYSKYKRHGTGFNPCFPGSSAERRTSPRRLWWRYGFNPCFPGSSAESVKPLHEESAVIDVSILVFLDQALKDLGSVVAGADLGFQSLFSWIKR